MNVWSNVKTLQAIFPDIALPEFGICQLGWNDEPIRYSAGYNSTLHFVVGSELVYKPETAHECAKIALRLLRDHSDVLVVIDQAADCEGWNSVFLPAIRRVEGVCIDEESPLRADAVILHDAASSIIRHGGTLNRFSDFAVCYISNSSSAY